MSYSFCVKTPTKDEAKTAVAKYFDERIIASQPIHARDRAAVLANVSATIDLLADDDTKDVQVSGNGYVNWTVTPDPMPLVAVSISSSASLVTREPK